MLIYIDEILNEIDSIREYAKIIRKKFKKGRDAEELLLDAKALLKRLEYLFSILPEGVTIGYTRRHINFMIRYLERSNTASCKQDIDDIVRYDLPEITQQIRQWGNNLQYVDADLRSEISTLIKTNQFDSAIRKAFVVLKTRLCDKFGLDHSIDGQDLVNKIFGQNSEYFSEMLPKQKQAYRDIYAGLFGLMRNRYMHNNIEATLTELDMTISSINYCLRLVDDFHNVETKKNGEGV